MTCHASKTVISRQRPAWEPPRISSPEPVLECELSAFAQGFAIGFAAAAIAFGVGMFIGAILL